MYGSLVTGKLFLPSPGYTCTSKLQRIMSWGTVRTVLAMVLLILPVTPQNHSGGV